MLIQPEIVITRSMFEKERNITQALIRQKGIDPKIVHVGNDADT